MSYDEIVSIIRKEISKDYDGEFSNTDHFVRDLHIDLEDLSFTMMDLEKKFGVKLDQSDYDHIGNVESYARAIERRLKSGEQPSPRRKRPSLISRLAGRLGLRQR